MSFTESISVEASSVETIIAPRAVARVRETAPHAELDTAYRPRGQQSAPPSDSESLESRVATVAFAATTHVPTQQRATLQLTPGKNELAANILEVDDAMFACEILHADKPQLFRFPRSLLPAEAGYGTPVWIGVDETSGTRRFVIRPRFPEPAALSAGRDELDSIIAEFSS